MIGQIGNSGEFARLIRPRGQSQPLPWEAAESRGPLLAANQHSASRWPGELLLSGQSLEERQDLVGSCCIEEILGK